MKHTGCTHSTTVLPPSFLSTISLGVWFDGERAERAESARCGGGSAGSAPAPGIDALDAHAITWVWRTFWVCRVVMKAFMIAPADFAKKQILFELSLPFSTLPDNGLQPVLSCYRSRRCLCATGAKRHFSWRKVLEAAFETGAQVESGSSESRFE